MHTNELPLRHEREDILPEVRAFLETEANNARFATQAGAAHEFAMAKALKGALADFDNGDYKTTVAILERYHGGLRTRADQETDIEAIPAIDNMNANRISTWIDLLRGLADER